MLAQADVCILIVADIKTEKVEKGLLVTKGITSVNRSLFSFCVR